MFETRYDRELHYCYCNYYYRKNQNPMAYPPLEIAPVLQLIIQMPQEKELFQQKNAHPPHYSFVRKSLLSSQLCLCTLCCLNTSPKDK